MCGWRSPKADPPKIDEFFAISKFDPYFVQGLRGYTQEFYGDLTMLDDYAK